MIHIAIVFIVAFVCLLIGRAIVLPHLLVFLPALKNPAITMAYNGAMNAGLSVLGMILAAIAVLYIVYQVLSRIPILGLIVKKMPPFRELKQSGLFDFISDLLAAPFAGSFKKIIIAIGRAFGNFVKRSFDMVGDTLRQMLGIPKKSSPPVFVVPSPPPADADKNKIPTEDVKFANERFNSCLEENTIIITPSMSSSEVTQANLKNSLAQINCKVSAFTTTLNNFTQTV